MVKRIILFVIVPLLGLATSRGEQLLGTQDVIAGPTPFISFARFRFDPVTPLRSAEFRISPKPGSETRPVHARYSSSYLASRGYLDAAAGKVTVPVFGLYAGRRNQVDVKIQFSDGPSRNVSLRIDTATFDGGTYSNPTVIQPRLPGTTLSYDFILLKNYSDADTPIILDTDAEVRWVGTAGVGTQNVILFDNAFYVAAGTTLYRTEFDGVTTAVADYSSRNVVNFHHNIDPGRDGMILDVDTVAQVECVNFEVDAAGNVLRTWNFASILADAMRAGGDNPDDFIARSPNDWYHNNATTYRASDNTLISSSRENFVIAIDYDTRQIKWILGDPTKHWYEFPSLRQYALALGPGTLPPIGQHAVSISRDQLLLFDDGLSSFYQQPPGADRLYSAPRKYQIDLTAFTANEVWHYYNDPPIYSPICSSVYEDAPSNYVIDYAVAGPYVNTKLMGLDDTGAKAFEYDYEAKDYCGTGWNAIQIHWENLDLR